MVMFTPFQWQELELQSLIFKYMASGIPVPSDLVLGIRRSLFVDSLLPPPPLPPSFGWGVTMHGAARDGDPEPGRCRRTDGKKWRCSKEAYPDSKYCERHMHRGKSRSRKPVESSPPLTATAASSSTFPPPPPLSLSTRNLPLLPFSSSRSASTQLDSANRSVSVVKEDSSDHFNTEKAAKFHCFFDEKPRKNEGSWMNLDVDQWKASAEHEDTALYLNFYGSS